MEFKIKSLDYNFRVKKMNVIEVLAIKTNMYQESIDDSIKFFNEVLERIEVQFEDKWLAVKMKDSSVLTPVQLESSIDALKEIVSFFVGTYLKQVFTKSNESSN